MGWIVGPLVGGLLVFRGADGNSGSVALPYTIIGIAVLLIAIVIGRVKLPEIKEEKQIAEAASGVSLWHSRTFVFGLTAIFFYVAAQTGINSFFINYVTESIPSVSARDAALMLSFGGMGFFFVGRLLLICALGASVCMLVVILGAGMLAVVALVLTYLCESIMFPTIFALALRGLDAGSTKRGSSYLIMGIVGGAIAPVLMGALGETDMAVGFIVPLVCFVVIAAFALHVSKAKKLG